MSRSAASTGGDAPRDASPRPRGRTRLLRALLVLGAALAALLLVETALWLVAPIRYHEWLLWEREGHIRARPVPGQTIRTAAGHEVRINRYGFRGPDYSREKPPGTLRIVVFGGSAAFCYHAAGEEKTWPGALERKLATRLGMPVQVVNLGLPGFSTFISKINYLCYGRMFEPDAILVYHTWNDITRFRGQEKAYYRTSTHVPYKPLWQRLARKTQIGRRARNFFWTITERGLEARFADMEDTGKLADRPASPRAFAWERQNFEDLVLLAQSDGVLPILVTQATVVVPENLEDPAVRRATATAVEGSGFTLPRLVEIWDAVSQIIASVARERGAVLVDGYRSVPSDLEHLRDAVHLHDQGAEVLAEEIARTLTGNVSFLERAAAVRAEGRVAQRRPSSDR